MIFFSISRRRQTYCRALPQRCRLKLPYDKVLPSFALNFNLRPLLEAFTKSADARAAAAVAAMLEKETEIAGWGAAS